MILSLALSLLLGASPSACVEGQSITPDTDGHCCWAGQVWSDGKCVGVPTTCPEGTAVKGQKCEAQPCGEGMVRASDKLHCCWPGQGYSKLRAVRVGVPTSCPTGMTIAGESCLQAAACAEGKVPTPDRLHCCWPRQSWSAGRNACEGTPSCPAGSLAKGDDCEAATGILTIESTPPGALVEIDGSDGVPTPVTYTVPAGKRHLKGILGGFDPIEQDANVEANGKTTATLKFNAGKVALSVNSTPPGAKISLDGEALGAAPLTTKVSGGAHKLEATLEGYVREEKTLELTPKSGPVSFVLAKEPTVRITSMPGGAEVTIDGQPAGKSPVSKGLPPGAHTVRVTADGYQASERQLQLKAGVNESFDFTLVAGASKPAEPSKAAETKPSDAVAVKKPDEKPLAVSSNKPTGMSEIKDEKKNPMAGPEGYANALTVSPVHFLGQTLKLTYERRLADKVSFSVAGGVGYHNDLLWLGTAQFRFYALGDFNHGLMLGAEGIVSQAPLLQLSFDFDTFSFPDWSKESFGYGGGAFLGYKFTAEVGFTLELQAGANFLFIGSRSGLAPMANLNLGWSFGRP